MMSDLMKNICTDIFSFQLGVLGISLTIFTVLFSFILSNRDEMRIYKDMILEENKSPIAVQRNSFARERIKKMRNMNFNILIICIISLISIVLSILLKYNIVNENLVSYIFYIVLCLAIITISYILIIFGFIIRSYFFMIKI